MLPVCSSRCINDTSPSACPSLGNAPCCCTDACSSSNSSKRDGGRMPQAINENAASQWAGSSRSSGSCSSSKNIRLREEAGGHENGACCSPVKEAISGCCMHSSSSSSSSSRAPPTVEVHPCRASKAFPSLCNSSSSSSKGGEGQAVELSSPDPGDSSTTTTKSGSTRSTSCTSTSRRSCSRSLLSVGLNRSSNFTCQTSPHSSWISNSSSSNHNTGSGSSSSSSRLRGTSSNDGCTSVLERGLMLAAQFLCVPDLCSCCLVCRRWFVLLAQQQQQQWRLLLLQQYGVKYENYFKYRQGWSWRLALAKAATFVRNLKQASLAAHTQPAAAAAAKQRQHEKDQLALSQRTAETLLLLLLLLVLLLELQARYRHTLYKELLRPSLPRARVRSLALCCCCCCFLWEDGLYIHLLHLEERREIWRAVADAPMDHLLPERSSKEAEGQAEEEEPRACLVATATKAIFLKQGVLRGFDLASGQLTAAAALPPAAAAARHQEFPLDVSLRNSQLTVLAGNSLFVFDSHTLRCLYTVTHAPSPAATRNPQPSGTAAAADEAAQDLDFLWAGYADLQRPFINSSSSCCCCCCCCSSSNHLSNEGPAPSLLRKPHIKQQPLSQQGQPAPFCCGLRRNSLFAAAIQQQQQGIRCSKHLVTWLRRCCSTIKIWAVADGALCHSLAAPSSGASFLRLRQLPHPQSLQQQPLQQQEQHQQHYLLAALDGEGLLTLYDSRNGFCCVCTLNCGAGAGPITRHSFSAQHLVVLQQMRVEHLLLLHQRVQQQQQQQQQQQRQQQQPLQQQQQQRLAAADRRRCGGAEADATRPNGAVQGLSSSRPAQPEGSSSRSTVEQPQTQLQQFRQQQLQTSELLRRLQQHGDLRLLQSTGVLSVIKVWSLDQLHRAAVSALQQELQQLLLQHQQHQQRLQALSSSKQLDPHQEQLQDTQQQPQQELHQQHRRMHRRNACSVLCRCKSHCIGRCSNCSSCISSRSSSSCCCPSSGSSSSQQTSTSLAAAAGGEAVAIEAAAAANAAAATSKCARSSSSSSPSSDKLVCSSGSLCLAAGGARRLEAFDRRHCGCPPTSWLLKIKQQKSTSSSSSICSGLHCCRKGDRGSVSRSFTRKRGRSKTSNNRSCKRPSYPSGCCYGEGQQEKEQPFSPSACLTSSRSSSTRAAAAATTEEPPALAAASQAAAAAGSASDLCCFLAVDPLDPEPQVPPRLVGECSYCAARRKAAAGAAAASGKLRRGCRCLEQHAVLLAQQQEQQQQLQQQRRRRPLRVSVQPSAFFYFPSSVYFCDILDNQLLAVWRTPQEQQQQLQLQQQLVLHQHMQQQLRQQFLIQQHYVLGMQEREQQQQQQLLQPHAPPPTVSEGQHWAQSYLQRLQSRLQQRQQQYQQQQQQHMRLLQQLEAAAASSVVGSHLLADWEVFDILPHIVAQQRPLEPASGVCGDSTQEEEAAAAIATPPCSCFSLRSRGDAWALLDWKAVAADPDGSLHVLDFCEISTKTEHDMLYIHPETGESFLPHNSEATK
ncbi:hypothetical protein Efla_001522 [Eimeria flavescens]